MKLSIRINQDSEKIVQADDQEILYEGKPLLMDLWSEGKEEFHVLKNGHSYHVELGSLTDQGIEVKINGKVYHAQVKDSIQILLETLGMSQATTQIQKQIKAPMPGLILKVLAEPGKALKSGEPVLILEAMKMENIIKATADCIIQDILIKPGQKVEKGQSLFILG
jgi:biotin carboxyl carrier protein